MVSSTRPRLCPPTCLPSQPANPTWQSEDGEVTTTFGEAGAVPDTRAPEALVVEHCCHWIIVQVLGAPLVHAR